MIYEWKKIISGFALNQSDSKDLHKHSGRSEGNFWCKVLANRETENLGIFVAFLDFGISRILIQVWLSILASPITRVLWKPCKWIWNTTHVFIEFRISTQIIRRRSRDLTFHPTHCPPKKILLAWHLEGGGLDKSVIGVPEQNFHF